MINTTGPTTKRTMKRICLARSMIAARDQFLLLSWWLFGMVGALSVQDASGLLSASLSAVKDPALAAASVPAGDAYPLRVKDMK